MARGDSAEAREQLDELAGGQTHLYQDYDPANPHSYSDCYVEQAARDIAEARRRRACRKWAEAHRVKPQVAADKFGLPWC